MASTTLKTYYLVDYKDGIDLTRRITIVCRTERGARQIAKDVQKYVLDLQIWKCDEESPVIYRTKLSI